MTVRRLLGFVLASVRDPYTFMNRCYARVIGWRNLRERLIFESLPSDVRHVLFACKGNICRSPLAAAYLQSRMKEQGGGLSIESAGLETTGGKEAHPLARLVAQRHGLSLDLHTTKPIVRELVDRADLILVMEPAQKARLVKSYPETKAKVFLLGYFDSKVSVEICDPYSGTIDDFELCYRRIQESCDNLLARVAPLSAVSPIRTGSDEAESRENRESTGL